MDASNNKAIDRQNSKQTDSALSLSLSLPPLLNLFVDAKEVCEETDISSKDCAIAWEEVEELRFASKRKLGEEESASTNPFAPTRPG